MTIQIFTSTGCARCKITKTYMQENNIAYEEFDIKAGGKEAFNQFYRQNRSSIYRDKDGVEFPICSDGSIVSQGVGGIIGYLKAGSPLEGFIGHSQLHGDWIGGFTICEGDVSQADHFLSVLTYLKKYGLKIELNTIGTNSALLKRILDDNLGHRLIMEIIAPKQLYNQLSDSPVEIEDISKSIKMAVQFPEYRFITKITPFQRAGGSFDYFTPDEVGDIARWIETETGSKKQSYHLRVWNQEDVIEDRLRDIAPLTDAQMFKYRTAARRYQVMTEIEK